MYSPFSHGYDASFPLYLIIAGHEVMHNSVQCSINDNITENNEYSNIIYNTLIIKNFTLSAIIIIINYVTIIMSSNKISKFLSFNN